MKTEKSITPLNINVDAKMADIIDEIDDHSLTIESNADKSKKIITTVKDMKKEKPAVQEKQVKSQVES